MNLSHCTCIYELGSFSIVSFEASELGVDLHE